MGKTGKKGGKRLKKKELAKMLMELFQNIPPRFTTLNVYSET